jgi:hypothetical protein
MPIVVCVYIYIVCVPVCVYSTEVGVRVGIDAASAVMYIRG